MRSVTSKLSKAKAESLALQLIAQGWTARPTARVAGAWVVVEHEDADLSSLRAAVRALQPAVTISPNSSEA